MQFVQALEDSKTPADINDALEAIGLKGVLEKCKYLIDYMKASVHFAGNINPDTQYSILQEEFLKGYWRDFRDTKAKSREAC
ncbi:MAG: hypothetical protein FWB91_02230 [Defluviitaleaceae bacterium]|nr:hypothetical protein [Defluviitaleaceae bacterium]